jgi:hypothetical protein
MAFFAPNFNLLANYWDAGHTPAVDPADLIAVPCQLYVASRGILDITPGNPGFWVPAIYFRTAHGSPPPQVGGIVGLSPGMTDFYKIRWVQNVHIGFANEYVQSLCEQCDANGTTPRP